MPNKRSATAPTSKLKPLNLTTRDAAVLLGVSPHTLENWRCKSGKGPKYVRVGGRVCYPYDELVAWNDALERRG